MIIVSNYILEKNHFPLPPHVVVRVNVAWVKTVGELERVLSSIEQDIYLDYPQGRSKPPRPTLTLEETIAFAHRFPRVKYFAVSNVENPLAIHSIQRRLPTHISVVPKIETQKGIEALEQIIEKIGAKYIMLDKEDLYIDVERDAELFEELIERAREKTERAGAEVLELHGVVFGLHIRERREQQEEVLQKTKEKTLPHRRSKQRPATSHRT